VSQSRDFFRYGVSVWSGKPAGDRQRSRMKMIFCDLE